MEQTFTNIDNEGCRHKCGTTNTYHGPYFTHKIGDRTLVMCKFCNKDFEVWLDRNYFDTFMETVGRNGNYRK